MRRRRADLPSGAPPEGSLVSQTTRTAVPSGLRTRRPHPGPAVRRGR